MKSRFFVFKAQAVLSILGLAFIACIIVAVLMNLIASANAGNETVTEPVSDAKLAVIIDDFGQARKGVKDVMDIDCKLTCAIMPFLEFSEQDMNDAISSGHEVIMHIPLQSQQYDNPDWLGENVVRIDHDDKHIKEQINSFAEHLCKAKGANIHMGALGSTDERVMTNIISVLAERDLFFVDSKTHHKSVCKDVAKKMKIDFYENDVFLENEGKDYYNVKRQLFKAAKIALKNGKAVAIGHIGPEGGSITPSVIRDCYKEIEQMGVEFVYASEVVETNS